MMKMRILLILGILFLLSTLAFGFEPEGEGKTLSPYFFVKSDDPALDQLPLKETKAKVNITGVIADIEIKQVYKNEGERTIEAVYVFPMGVRAAIHGMKMKIGERTIEARIEKREEAKRRYEQAKKGGKVASLLEQERPNIFQMKVANIMPQDSVEVTVEYTEMLVPEEGIYEFVFPTVVGPRYSNITEEEAGDHDRWVKSPYLHEDEEPAYDFDIEVRISSGIPIAEVGIPWHKVNTKWQGRENVSVMLDPSEKKSGNRDFILKYSLEGKKIDAGLLLYPGEDENFFLLMVQPPERVRPKEIPPREYVFIVDVSGSMNGFPLSVSKQLIKKIIKGLREIDYLNILFFAGGSNVFSEKPLPANQENKARAIEMLEAQRGGGGTELLPALKNALSLAKKEGLSRIVVVATDGYVRVEKEAFDLIRENLDKGNLFSFGIGKSVNRYIIEGMARAGAGEPFVATDKKEASKMAEKFAKYVSTPILTDIGISFSGFETFEIEPPSYPDLFAERLLIIFGKYREASGKIAVKGKMANGGFEKEISVLPTLEHEKNSALRYLWARWRIARLSDYGRLGENVRTEVTELGLRYNLMTQYTSFVAVDTIVRETGEVVTVKQPLPLPEGVSDYALLRHARQVPFLVGTFLGGPTGKQGDVAFFDKKSRGHLRTELTMGDYLAFAEKVTNKMLVSSLVRSWGKKKPRLIVGDLVNNTDNENIRIKDFHDCIQETIFNSGLVRIVDKSAAEFDYIIKTELTYTRQYGKDGQELAFFTMQMKLFKPDGELMSQWSDDLPFGKAKRRLF